MKFKIIIAFILLFAGIANAGDAAVKRTDYKSARTGYENNLLHVLTTDGQKLGLTYVDEVYDASNNKIGKFYEYGDGHEPVFVGNGKENAVKGIVNDPSDIWKLSLQNLGKPASGTVLGENLVAVGKVRPANSHAHHITAGGASNPFAVDARSILQREGIDINEGANGVFLPSSSKYAIDNAIPHANVHTNVYYENVFTRLNNAQTGKVRNELQKIAEELLNGTFPY